MDKDSGASVSESQKSHSPSPVAAAGLNPLRRDNDSLDDFEHLEHDPSPVKTPPSAAAAASMAAADNWSFQQAPLGSQPASAQLINTTTADNKFADELKSGFENLASAKDQIVSDVQQIARDKMSSVGDLLGMDDDYPKKGDLLGDFSYAPPPIPAHSEDFTKEFPKELPQEFPKELPQEFPKQLPQEFPKDLPKELPKDLPKELPKEFPNEFAKDITKDITKDFGDFDNFKSATQNFMDTERDVYHSNASGVPKEHADFADRFSDSEPENEPDVHSSNEDIKMSSKDTDFQFHKGDAAAIRQPEIFKDVIEEPEGEQPELPQRDYLVKKEPSPVPVREPPVITTTPEIVEPVKQSVHQPEPVRQQEPVRQPDTPVCKLPGKPKKQEVMGAEAMFCQMGLDAWFNPERLNPKVESLIYWRDPKKSGAVFGGTLVVLLSLAYFSFISVSAYLSLLALAGTISFRIYKNVLQAVQKTSDGHPFKEQLEADINLPQDKVREITDIAVAHLNAAVTELRRLFLVEDLVDSIKFGVLLWCLTYLGAWFNGMTLIIIAFVALFTLPKVYENNKQQIDANLDIVRTKVAEITSKVKAAIPIGKKSDEKKE